MNTYTSASSHDGETGARFTFSVYLQHLKNGTKCMQQWFSDLGQQAVQDSNPWAKEDKWSELHKVSTNCLDWVSRPRHRKKEPNLSLAVSPSWEFAEYKVVRTIMADCQREESGTDSELPRSTPIVSSVWVTTGCEETTWSQGRSHEKGEESHQDRNCSCSQ